MLPPILRANYQPVATIDYYLALARYLRGEWTLSAAGPTPLKTAGFVLDEGERAERRMELVVSDGERGEAEAALQELLPISSIENQKTKVENFVVMVPGANFGASKCWMPERFAAVAELLADPAGAYRARVILAGSPAEGAICEAIWKGIGEKSRGWAHLLGSVNGGKGVSIGALKEIVRRGRMMICNDTGPRHMAVAFGVPVVTVFGPTDPVWAETYFEKERIVRVPVPCGPCQLKVCPIDHRCMKRITVEMVMQAVGELWEKDQG
jgi:heptosyltransferase-2